MWKYRCKLHGYSRRIRAFFTFTWICTLFSFTIEKRPVASSPRYVAVTTYLGLLATKPQPTNDFVHIQGQNNSFRSNIFVGFAEDKIEDFAKLKLKMHFIGRDVAWLWRNIDFQPQKVGGQRIGSAHKDWKVNVQLPALPNRLRRLCWLWIVAGCLIISILGTRVGATGHCSKMTVGPFKTLPILVTERWARSWSRCTGCRTTQVTIL